MKIICLFLFCTGFFVKGQNEFEHYGPLGSDVYTDLKEALKSAKKVYKLDLTYQIDPKSYNKISDLTDLQAIKLGTNGVTDYPQDFNHLVNLVYFSSANNKLVRFLPDLKAYMNLHYLDLQHTAIDSIPAHIAYLSRLKTFKFGNTDDTLKLPDTFKYLKKLTDLFFENCILDSFPKQIFKAPGLKFLYLSNTNTKYLTRHFERLPNLEVLVVENNHLVELPFDIYKAQKLRLISLRGNRLTKLPPSISQLEHLSLLDLRGNNFTAEDIEELRALLPGCQIKF